MQPSFHARFLTNHQKEFAYLCDGKAGFIQKEFPINLTKEIRLEFQLNSLMQIQYENQSNIRFAFTCENEYFQFQLAKTFSSLEDLTSTIVVTKKLSSNLKRSNSILANQLEQQQSLSRKSFEQANSYQDLPILQELNSLKKRIKSICHSWLQFCRSVLGILDINAYHLPDYHLLNQYKTTKSIHLQIPFNNQYVKSLDREQFLINKRIQC